MEKKGLRKKSMMGLIGILIFGIGVSALAQPGDRQPTGERPEGGPPRGGFIQHLDSDGDGKVSQEEFLAEFHRLEQNQDGYIDDTEVPQPPQRGQGQQGQRPNRRANQ